VGLVAIAGTDFRINGGTIMAHAGNFVLALVVLLFTRLPVVSTHFQVGSGAFSAAHFVLLERLAPRRGDGVAGGK
jgi:hypothetical protein